MAKLRRARRTGVPEPGILIGTAGWSIPVANGAALPGEGSHLERYAGVLRCAEINSTFYRPHRASTYARWVASTPEHFRFSVKAPRAITHECELRPSAAQVREFLGEAGQLGGRLGPILFQLPPRQAFEPGGARGFLGTIRDLRPDGGVALEPRHPSWFEAAADGVLEEFRVARVIADPSRGGDAAASEGGYRELIYHRLHGSPRMYYSSYSGGRLAGLAATLRGQGAAAEVWCIFDNTASGAAMGDALELMREVASPGEAASPKEIAGGGEVAGPRKARAKR